MRWPPRCNATPVNEAALSVKTKSSFEASAANSENPPLARVPAEASPKWRLDAIVAELRLSRDVTHNIRPKGRFRRPPSREAIASVVEGLAAALFPAHYGGPDLAVEAIDYQSPT